MSDTILHQSNTVFNTQHTLADDLAAGLRMLEELHRTDAAGAFWYFSRPAPNGGYEQDWRTAGMHGKPRQAWQDNDHLFFSVNPHTEIPQTNAKGERRAQQWVRGTAENIAWINALFVEIDAKDTIAEDEWMPFYVAPDVAGMTKSKARGELQKAQTAAIDKALVQDLAKYKRRAWNLIQRAKLRPSACWDSGGGYQAVWLLDQTLPIDNTNRPDVQRIQKAWVELIGGDPAASDLNRVLRLPGSVNRKAKYGPAGHEVRFMWCDLGRRYSFAELAALVPDAPAVKPSTPRRVFVPAGLPQELGDFADVPILPHHPAIDAYNASTGLHDLLLEYGYTDAGSGRMNRPGGDSAGVQMHGDNTASIYSSGDPLYCGHRVTPAHALVIYEYDGDLDKMLTALTGCPHPLPPMNDTMKWELLTWAQSKEARDLLRDGYGIRRPDGYLRTLEALIVLAARRGAWCFTPGLRAVANTCNAAHQSIAKHLTWFSGTLWQTWQTDRGATVDLGLVYWLYFRRGYAKVDTSTNVTIQDPYAKGDSIGTIQMQTPVTLSVGNAGAENFGGVNLSVGVQFQHDHLRFDAFVPVAYSHGMARRMETTVLLPSLGFAGRVAWAAMLESPGITRQEIAEQSGVSARTLEKTLQRMERMLLVTVTEDADGEKHYTLAADAMGRLTDLLPDMTSYKTGVRRAELGEQSRAKWLYKQYRAAQSEAARAGIKEKMRKCDALQVELRAELAAAGIHPAKGKPKMHRRWDHAEIDRTALSLAQGIAAAGDAPGVAYRRVRIAGYTADEEKEARKPSVQARVRAAAAAHTADEIQELAAKLAAARPAADPAQQGALL